MRDLDRHRAEARDWHRIRRTPQPAGQPAGEPAHSSYGSDNGRIVWCPACQCDTLAAAGTGRCMFCDLLLLPPATEEAAA